MKKFVLIIFILFQGNGGFSQTKYVTTLYPFKNILESVVGSRGQVYSILPPGASPHTYLLRPSEILNVETASAFFLGGHNLDEWALKFQNPYRIELIDLIPEKYLKHFNFENHPESGREDEIDNQHEHGSGVDPHFWTDPLLVKSLLPILADTLGVIDPEGYETYKNNAARFTNQLDSLYLTIAKYLTPVRGKSVILSHPFFRYFLDRFEIKLFYVIESSPGKELTPRGLRDIIKKVKNENVKAIFVHPQLPDRSARVIAESTGISIYELDPIGGVPGRRSYSELLLYNAQIILETLK